MQLQVLTPDGSTYYNVNAGKATSEGLEVAARQRLGDALLLTVNAACTDAYATQAVPAAGIFVGARLPTSPKWTVAAMLDYQMRDLDGWTPHLSGSWRHFSAQYDGISTAPPVGLIGLIPAYSWVDLDLRMTKGRYDLSLYAKNLLDNRAFNFGGPSTDVRNRVTWFAGTPIQPRTVGISATMTF